jgi:formylglycine-generating enzyme required for sulfatase activity
MMPLKLIDRLGLTSFLTVAVAGSVLAGFVHETEREYFGNGDFDGDGRTDVLVVDRASGKYRIGYAQADGTFNWINNRLSGTKDLTGVTVGRLFDARRDALAVAAADANQAMAVEAPNPGQSSQPVPLPIESLGPHAVLALEIGGDGNTPWHDLMVVSIYNDPDPFKATLFRNATGQLGSAEVITETTLDRQPVRLNRVVLKTGGSEWAAGMLVNDVDSAWVAADFSGPEPQIVARLDGLPKDTAYAVGHFRGRPEAEVLFYQPGGTMLRVAAVQSASADSATLDTPEEFDLGKPVKLAVPVPGGQADRLLVIFGKGDGAEVFTFDAVQAPVSAQSLAPKAGDLFLGAVPLEKAFLILEAPDYSKFTTHQQTYIWADGTYTTGPYGKIGSMADNDDATVPEIWKRILATMEQESLKSPTDMKPYTNTIPGTQVTYVMIPVPGGEFEIGSPDTEPGRKPDEGPRRKIKISPFWIGKFEVTWNEYELFMYPDDEKKLRAEFPTQEYMNKVSDAVTRPSKPYTEMSFGMGRDGYPAICMTQHSANKYCHWLSAKTGHFYRLPTEAEWEYACRAGTTTAYSFGDDPAKLGEHAWFEENGDFKYQKIGRKKPNPWGLHDMHGNVWEWCLDEYVPDYAKVFEKAGLVDPWYKATVPYPHVVRGGSYDDPPDRLRSAARRGSDRTWKMRDPQLPKSIWWHSDAPWVGFRLVRPFNVPTADKLQQFWTSGVERD